MVITTKEVALPKEMIPEICDTNPIEKKQEKEKVLKKQMQLKHILKETEDEQPVQQSNLL